MKPNMLRSGVVGDARMRNAEQTKRPAQTGEGGLDDAGMRVVRGRDGSPPSMLFCFAYMSCFHGPSASAESLGGRAYICVEGRRDTRNEFVKLVS